MTFRVGQKVVCIDEWPPSSWRNMWDQFWHPYKSPLKGGIYTVSNVYTYDDGELALELFELPNRDEFWCDGFRACGFRPIVERKTDISIFKRMLTPAQEPACTSS